MGTDLDILVQRASQLAAKGKGLLASDESTGTIGKRLEKAGIQNTEVTAAVCSICLCRSSWFHMQRRASSVGFGNFGAERTSRMLA
jgi:fructose-bisphosphate aldolase class 1